MLNSKTYIRIQSIPLVIAYDNMIFRCNHTGFHLQQEYHQQIEVVSFICIITNQCYFSCKLVYNSLIASSYNLIHKLQMSFFNKLFGGNDKKTAAPPPPPTKSEAEKIAEKKIKIEAALNDLDIKIKTFEEKEKKFDNKIEILKNKAKELIAADRKKDAKKYVEEATKVQKQAQSYTLRKKVLVDKKFQLEQAIMDMETIDALDSVGDHLKEQDKYSDKLQDIILDGEEAKMRQKEIDDKMRDMVGGESDEEEVDEMFNELMNEVKKEKAPPNKNINVNVGPVQTNKNANKQVDDIDDMLANL